MERVELVHKPAQPFASIMSMDGIVELCGAFSPGRVIAYNKAACVAESYARLLGVELEVCLVVLVCKCT